MDTISPFIEEVINSLQTAPKSPLNGDSDAVIEVNKLTMKAGALYEKVRYMVDYREENTLRRSAIERILKRKIILESKTDVGLLLLQELVSGGYLTNASVGEESAHGLQHIVDKYLSLQTTVALPFLLSMAATEIELHLSPFSLENAIAEAFYQTIHKSIRPTYDIPQAELDAQIYIACRRSLLKKDNESLVFALWLRYVPEWKNLSIAEVDANRDNYTDIIQKIYNELKNPLGWNITARLRNQAIYFTLIKEVIEKFGGQSTQTFLDQNYLKEYISSYLDLRYQNEFERTKRSSIRAVIYVFFTKMILAVVSEIPYDLAVLQRLDLFPLITNLLFHPILLLIMTRTIKPLGKENTDRIYAGVVSMVYNRDIPPIKLKPDRGATFLSILFSLFYLGIFFLSFGLLLWILLVIGFNFVSILLFLFFLTFVSYFGLRIRYNAKKWKIEVSDETTLGLLWSIFTLPIVRTGRWLSATFSSINIFVFVLDFIIETPFQLILRTSDLFLNFLKEKREELY